MLTDRVNDIDHISGIYFDLDRENRVAGKECVLEYRIFRIRYAVPCYACRLTASQYSIGLNRYVHRQVHGEVLGDEVLCVTYGIRVQTGGVERVINHDTGTVSVRPYIRCIQYTDRRMITMLGYYAQLVDNLTACYFINTVFGVGLRGSLRNGVAHPENGVALMQDLILDRRTDRVLHDLVIDRTVAACCRTRDGNGITIDRVRNQVVVRMTIR